MPSSAGQGLAPGLGLCESLGADTLKLCSQEGLEEAAPCSLSHPTQELRKRGRKGRAAAASSRPWPCTVPSQLTAWKSARRFRAGGPGTQGVMGTTAQLVLPARASGTTQLHRWESRGHDRGTHSSQLQAVLSTAWPQA